MEHSTDVSLIVMYEDESLDVRYVNGAQLQLSPCGCEYMLVKATDPSGHPLQIPERVRQRTRFTISTYKEMLMAALTFRNKYTSRPYLPEELILACHKKPFFSIDLDVQWPEWSSCCAESGPGGEIIIRSEEGRAALILSPSGEEFSVEFTCNLSRDQNQFHSMEDFSRELGQQHVNNLISQTATDKTKEVHQRSGSRGSECMRSRSCSPQITGASQPKPEAVYQSTKVVQHHSCTTVAPIWSYPLSLAHHFWTNCLSKSEDGSADTDKETSQPHRKTDMSHMSVVERQSHLPKALPLTCPSPHWHRWKVKDPPAKNGHLDQDLSTELVKVMWCHGVTYRILSGAVSVIEISPGDGSVIRSNGILSTYFTHHKPDLQSGQVREVIYHLNNLPPDIPGQLYSVRSVLSRASRILTCYNDAKQSLKLPATPSCLQEGGYLCQLKYSEENLCSPVSVEQHINGKQTAESQSDLVAAELEKIKQLNFVLDNNHQFGGEKRCAEVDTRYEGGGAPEAVKEDFIAEALRRTSRAIQDIDALISAATLT